MNFVQGAGDFLMLDKFANFVSRSKADLTYRQLPHYSRSCVDFSSNNYLGLSQQPEVIEAGIAATRKYGAGATGSRLLSGNYELFEEFEAQIARDKGTDAALIFNCGFQANSGVIGCLSDKHNLVIFDMLNHASMYQGVFASGAKLKRFQHLDYTHLEDILKNALGEYKDILVVSDTVFGMDGDIADIQALIEISEKYGAILYLDEAHATGLYGKGGYGLSTNFDFDKEKVVIMGTFSKAIGSSGAYVACSALVKDFLIQKCKSFIYSTALSPFCIGAAQKAWEMLPSLNSIRQNIMRRAEKIRSALGGGGSKTNIVPILFKTTEEMMLKKQILEANGIIVSGIRPPTSPTPRLRIAVNATHTDDDIEKLIGVLA